MQQHQTLLRCSQTTAFFLFVAIGSLFIVTGCAQLYKTIGMSDEQVLEQVAADQQIKEQILGGVRHTTTEIITTTIAGLGAIASGFLAKWLGTERKITKAIITGVENSQGAHIKDSIKASAIAAGVEKQLSARVQTLT